MYQQHQQSNELKALFLCMGMVLLTMETDCCCTLTGLKTWLRPSVQQIYGSEVPRFCCKGESTRMRRL
ncbi:hypothetical protein OJAV_G00166350 [Xyrichtys novacula]|uniref:Secreted protein n=1 Tax=Xyrichtys novacula TaxID=13765 RepID=A0AAV1GIF1_XYRNO|nr:hypothetical protein OJAV_G00166350 [Xyrichtys novacula]